MKRKKLELKRQTIAVLHRDQLPGIVGGAGTKTANCASYQPSRCATQCASALCETAP